MLQVTQSIFWQSYLTIFLLLSPKHNHLNFSFKMQAFLATFLILLVFQIECLHLKRRKISMYYLTTYWVFLNILLSFRRKHRQVTIKYNLSQWVHQRGIMYNKKNLLKVERNIRHITRHGFSTSIIEQISFTSLLNTGILSLHTQ